MNASRISRSARSGDKLAFRQIASVIHPWRWSLLGATLSVLAGAALALVPSLIIRRLIDENLKLGQAEGLLTLAVCYLGATVTMQLMNFATGYLMAITAQGALHRIRVRLFAHLQQLPLSYYDWTPLGDVLARCTSDVETVNTLFSSGVINVVTELFRLVTTFIAMVALSPWLSIVTILIIPPVAAITHLFRTRIRSAERLRRRAIGLMNAKLQETLSGIEVIRAFHREDIFAMRFRSALHEMLLAGNRATRYEAVYSPLMAILAAAGTGLLFWLGSTPLFASSNISLGTLTAFVLLFQQFFSPITQLGNDWQTVQSALSGAERIFQVLSLPIETVAHKRQLEMARANPKGGARLQQNDDTQARIELSNVSFGYLPRQPVLQDVSLVVEPGRHVAIVGRTGAGKSSLVHLLAGLYEPWSGLIRLAGRDPRTFSEDERRHIVGVVTQTAQLFGGTVLENLTLGDMEVSRDKVQHTATLTGADAFICKLPGGYDTLMSDLGRGAGVQLSAGQRQLLTLTRALIWDPEVLLLDEATASVDSATEAAFRRALDAHLHERRRSVLTVAHRLSTARETDYIVVLEAGRVIEEGPPDELLTRGGRFAALWELEAAGWDWPHSCAGASGAQDRRQGLFQSGGAGAAGNRPHSTISWYKIDQKYGEP